MMTPRMVREASLLLLVSSTVLGTACHRSPSPSSAAAIRLGFFPNLTHAQALVGQAEGSFAERLKVPVSARVFNAGPAAMEALLAGDVDLAYVGPGPATIAYLRSHGEALCVIAGAVSGGAELVARSARAPRDLLGRRVASPQLGNTQDIALRMWLREQGLLIGEGTARVQVTPLNNSDILAMFSRGEIEAAWVPEPWGARLRAEAGGRTLVDERDLWKGHAFPTTVVVASRRTLNARRGVVVNFLRVHIELTARWKAHPAEFARAANLAFGNLTHHLLPDPVLQDAFSRLSPTVDPLAEQLTLGARRAQELAFAPAGDLAQLVDPTPLKEAEASLAPPQESSLPAAR